MRLWPLSVGTLLPGISFDKVDGPVWDELPGFPLPFETCGGFALSRQQSRAKVSGICPQRTQANPPLGSGLREMAVPAWGTLAQATGSG